MGSVRMGGIQPGAVGVVLYLAAVIGFLMLGQSVMLVAFREPLQWTFGASSAQPKSLKLALKILLQTTLIGSLILFPFLVGSNPARYFGPFFPPGKAYQFFIGELMALALAVLVFGTEVKLGWLYYQPRYPVKKALTKSGLSALSSLTVVAVEEPFFRGIILHGMLAAAMPALIAIPVSAVLFSLAHFIRKVSTYYPAIGLAVLGVWLGVCFYKTGAFWLPMGLHSGGILAIGVHRCFLNYKAPAWLVGTQTFPIAGAIAIAIMLAGATLTWFAHF